MKFFLFQQSSAHFTSILYYPCLVSNNTIDVGEVATFCPNSEKSIATLTRPSARLSEDPSVDQLRSGDMKKRKLKLKDWIAYLESQLIPDLDA